jgi:hypothetical protein
VPVGAKKRWAGRTAVLAAAAGLAAPAALGQPGAPLRLSAFTHHPGHISLRVLGGMVGASATITESGAAGAAPVTVATLQLTNATTTLKGAVRWSCDPSTPVFTVSETPPGASAPTQTAATSFSIPSCATRVQQAIVPGRLHAGYPFTVELTDRWGLGGLPVKVCLRGGGVHDCHPIVLAARGKTAYVRLHPRRAGPVHVLVSDAYATQTHALRVHGGRPLLLATGDSEMQILDDDIASDLSGRGGVRVLSDARQATAISTPFLLNWPAHAVQQVDRLHPDIVAMFLGGNEGFSLSGVQCCGTAYARRYADRVAGMMKTYLQGGAAEVYWFLIPTPSKPNFVRVARVVDAGIERAARRFAHGVQVVDLRRIFSPGGHYLQTLDYHGHEITVHESDGFHLSAQSDTIVAQLFAARLRHDGFLPA